MSDVLSKKWLKEVGDWATGVVEKGLEGLVVKKKSAATADPKAGDPGSSVSKKWLPYVLIVAALIGLLFLFKGKK